MTEGDTHPAAQEIDRDAESPSLQAQLDHYFNVVDRLHNEKDALKAKLTAAEALVTHLTQERDALSVKERREFAWAEEYMQLSRTLTLKVEALQAQLATLHREQAALVEQLIVELREIAEGFRAADAETLLSFLDSFERRLTKPTSLSQEPSDP